MIRMQENATPRISLAHWKERGIIMYKLVHCRRYLQGFLLLEIVRLGKIDARRKFKSLKVIGINELVIVFVRFISM